MSGDVHWNMVPLLVPCSASPFVEARHAYTVNQGSTTVTFSSSVKPSASFAGSASFSGVTSAPTGSAGTQLRVGSTDDFTLGSGDFTIECWATANTLAPPADSGLDEMIPHVLVERAHGSGGNAGDWSLQVDTYRIQGTPDQFRYKFGFYCVEYSASAMMLEGSDIAAGFFDWLHIAVTRNGNEWVLWRQGIPDARVLATPTMVSPSPGADIRVGNSVADTSNLGNAQSFGRSFDGYITGVRLTKGYCRYGRSFQRCFVDMNAPPGLPFPEAIDSGDYSGPTFAGDTGPAGTNAVGEPLQGPAGSGGGGVAVALPPPTPQYDVHNETQTRRLIEAASRRV